MIKETRRERRHAVLYRAVRPGRGIARPAGAWIHVQSAQLGYRPKNPVTLDDTARAEVEAFLKAVDADDDVQNIYAGLAD